MRRLLSNLVCLYNLQSLLGGSSDNLEKSTEVSVYRNCRTKTNSEKEKGVAVHPQMFFKIPDALFQPVRRTSGYIYTTDNNKSVIHHSLMVERTFHSRVSKRNVFVFVEQNGYNLFSILSFNTVGTKQNVLVNYLFCFWGHSYFFQM